MFSYFEGEAMFPTQRDGADVHVSALTEVRFGAGFNSGEISGYASTWGGPPDSYGTVFAKGAFSQSLSEHQREKTSPVMLWAHAKSELIGKWTVIREDEYGLYVEGKLNLSTARGQEAHAHLKAGDLSGLSVGTLISRDAFKPNRDGTTTIVKADLYEISVVGVPANRRARIQQVRTLQTKAELVDLLRDGGIPKAAANRIASNGWAGLTGVDDDRIRDLAAKISQNTQAIRSMK